jgi:superfamily II DNA or RNA helicase
MQLIMNACRQIYPMELSAPPGLIPTCKLRTYQKQSLAFMVNREKGTHDDDYRTAPMERKLFRRQQQKSDYSHRFTGIKTGLLCSEVGMGKTLVCIALVCANPGDYKRLSDAQFKTAMTPMDTWVMSAKDSSRNDRKWGIANLCQQLCTQDLATEKYKIKTTVISTTNTIVGQWYDEIKKFAPSINVKVHHGSYKSSPDFFNQEDPSSIQDVDILLTVNTTAPPPWCLRFTFHRIISDEIHQYFLPYYHSKRVWGVTATPFEKMSAIFQKFGQTRHGLALESEYRMQLRTKETISQSFINKMNTFMIRHTKDQEIQGKEALKLPPMLKTTINIVLSAEEQKHYLSQRNSIVPSSDPRPLTAIGIDSTLDKIRRCVAIDSKLIALGADYDTLLAENPSANVVIFSRFAESIQKLKDFFSKKTIGKQKIVGYWLKSSSAASSRHKAIRNFQDPTDTRPKVLAISYKTGQCGITLTAASRVYLLEPCILPSDEIQAGGRISRLGQTKEISLVRLVALNTCDEAIIEMHQNFATGVKSFTPEGNIPYSCIGNMLRKGSDAPPLSEYTLNSHSTEAQYYSTAVATVHEPNLYGDICTTYSLALSEKNKLRKKLNQQENLASALREMFSNKIDAFRQEPCIISKYYQEPRPSVGYAGHLVFDEGRKRKLKNGSRVPVYTSSTAQNEVLANYIAAKVNGRDVYGGGYATSASQSVIVTNQAKNVAWAALYRTNVMSDFVEEYDDPRSHITQKRQRFIVSQDLNKETTQMLECLEVCAKYGRPCSGFAIAQKYAKALRDE